MGHMQAAAWMENQKRGNPVHGGTLQSILLDYARRFAGARGTVQRDRVRGEIVGFSMSLECPDYAAKLDAYARKRRIELSEARIAAYEARDARKEAKKVLARFVAPSAKRKLRKLAVA
jgi:hypothetical protein